MSFPDKIARWIWGGILSQMRKPSSRQAQKRMLQLIPDSKREKFRQRAIKNEKFARKIGLPLLTFTVKAFIIWTAGVILYIIGLELQERGLLPGPVSSQSSNLEWPVPKPLNLEPVIRNS